MAKLKVNFTLADDVTKTATGREAETLLALVNAGSTGITSLDAFKAGWAVRLAAYVFDLKAMGVPIEATTEPHAGGRHARYRLAGPVNLLSDAPEISRAAA